MRGNVCERKWRENKGSWDSHFPDCGRKSKEKETQDYRRRRMKQVPKRTRGPRKDTETEGSSYYIWPLPDSFCSVSDEAGCRSYPRIFFYLCKTWRFFLFCLSFDSPWPACTPSKTSSTQGRRGLWVPPSQREARAILKPCTPCFPSFRDQSLPCTAYCPMFENDCFKYFVFFLVFRQEGKSGPGYSVLVKI